MSATTAHVGPPAEQDTVRHREKREAQSQNPAATCAPTAIGSGQTHRRIPHRLPIGSGTREHTDDHMHPTLSGARRTAADFGDFDGGHGERQTGVMGKEREGEGQRDKGRQKHVLVENQETLQHLQLVLVRRRTADLVVQLLVRERRCRLEALVRQRWPTPLSVSRMTP